MKRKQIKKEIEQLKDKAIEVHDKLYKTFIQVDRLHDKLFRLVSSFKQDKYD